MFFMTASTGSLVVGILCAVAIVAISVAAVWRKFAADRSAGAPAHRHSPQGESDTEQDAERYLKASNRLRDLAGGIACDVGNHRSRVEQLSKTLQDLSDVDGKPVDAAVFDAVAQIVSANSRLRNRLVDAEKQIEAQSVEIQSQEAEARTDSLTGLANRRAFDDELNRRLAEWLRKDVPFALLLMDIDHFKTFNDKHGHQAGDEVLRQVGHLLHEATREMDVPCRYGGEEFAVIMPATPATDATILAERIRTTLANSATHFDDKLLHVTISVGLAEVDDQDDAQRILKRADDALYTSKAAGRNCSHLHLGGNCIPISPGVPAAGASSAASAATPRPTSASKPAAGILGELPEEGAFCRALRRRLAESHRCGTPLCVMQLQIDQYDSIRDRFGPAAAQSTFDSAARIVETSLREMDLLAWSEGGRFIVMLPGSIESDARQVNGRVQAALAGCRIPMGQQQLKVTVRHGVAQAAQDDSADTLMERARQAMGESIAVKPQATGV